jgi:hypothetical protein
LWNVQPVSLLYCMLLIQNTKAIVSSLYCMLAFFFNAIIITLLSFSIVLITFNNRLTINVYNNRSYFRRCWETLCCNIHMGALMCSKWDHNFILDAAPDPLLISCSLVFISCHYIAISQNWTLSLLSYCIWKAGKQKWISTFVSSDFLQFSPWGYYCTLTKLIYI